MYLIPIFIFFPRSRIQTKQAMRCLSKYLVRFWIILFSATWCFGQSYTLQDTSLAKESLQRAADLQTVGKYDSALTFYHQAATIYRELNHWEDYIQCQNRIGATYRRTGDYEKALHYQLSGIQLAKTHLKENAPVFGTIYNSLGILYAIKGKNDSAIVYFEEALQIGLEGNGTSTKEIAYRYQNLGNIYRRDGKYSKALDYQLKALRLKQTVFGDRALEIAYSYNNIGLIYQDLEDYDQSLHYHHLSLEIKQKLLPENHPDIAGSYFNIGLVYEEMEQNQYALLNLQKSLKIEEKVYLNDHPYIAESLEHMGIIFLRMASYSAADSCFNEALEIYRNTVGENSPDVANLIRLQGNLLAKQHQYDAALDNYQQALNLLVDDFEDSNPLSNPLSDQLRTRSPLLEILRDKSNALHLIYDSKTSHDVAYLEGALHTALLAFHLTDLMRLERSSESSQLILGRKMRRFYENSIHLALQLESLTSESKYKDLAFQISERAHAAVLNAALTAAQAQEFAGIPDSLLSLEQSLQSDRTFYKLAIQKASQQQNPDSARIQNYRSTLFNLNRQYEQLVETFEHNYPKYHTLKYQVQYPTPSEIQAKLPENSSVLEYFMGQTSLFLFVISPDEFHYEVLPYPDSVTTCVKNLRFSLQGLNFDGYTKSASRLYDLLMKPVMPEIKDAQNLVIIPDGILNYLPFETLLTTPQTQKNRTDFSTLNYLLRKYSVHYHFSGSLWLQSEGKKSHPYPTRLLAVAPVFDSTVQDKTPTPSVAKKAVRQSASLEQIEFTPLPESQNEILGIKKLFRQKGLPAKTLLYNQASEGMFKSAVSADYNFIHLATHGLINDEHPELSGLVFSPDTTSDEDGVLYSSETFNLHLDADLVVLSACESGMGPLAQGEGIMGLTRGIFYSGARQILVSLWQVDDKSTTDLMIRFYRKLLQDEEPAEALRQAKLEMITGQRFAYPLEWSSFVLIGY